MRYTVFLKERATGDYMAFIPAVPGFRAEGDTRTEALDRLRISLENWLRGMEVTSIEVTPPKPEQDEVDNPWLATAGMFADDPDLLPMLAEIYAERDAEKPVD